MPSTKLCQIPGCEQPHEARGWCQKHYQRWKTHGDPEKLVLTTPRKAGISFLIDVAATYEGDECLIWPYGRMGRGYASVFIDGATVPASRVLCTMTHGEPPTPDHQAAHSCGKGHLGCITKRHLRWATRLDNETDKIEHGTLLRGSAAPWSKLTESDVISIRSDHSAAADLADRYGVSAATIHGVRARRSWAWLS